MVKRVHGKNGIKVEQVTPWGVNDEMAQKNVNFDFNARRGFIMMGKDIPNEILKAFEGRRAELTLPNLDFQSVNEDMKYYLLSHSLFYIALSDDISAIEAMSVGTPLIYIKKNEVYECGIEIDDVNDLKKIEMDKEEWEDLSWKCWFKSLRYHYITIGQELWEWLK